MARKHVPTNASTTMAMVSGGGTTTMIKAFFVFLISTMAVMITEFHQSFSLGITEYISTVSKFDEGNPGQVEKKNYGFTTAICMITKDSEHYLTEWIDYHLLAMNFDNIYVYDNSVNFDLRRWYHNTRDHPQYKRVDIIHYPNSKKQIKEKTIWADAYTDCLEKYGKNGPRHDYIAFIDSDEYIALRQPPDHFHSNIHDLLAEYLHPFNDAGALALNWMYFGNANRTVYSTTPLLKRYQYREWKPMAIIKSIVKSINTETFHNVHGGEYYPGRYVYGTNKPGARVKLSKDGGAVGSRSDRNDEIAVVNHYHSMSSKEFLLKYCSGKLSTLDKNDWVHRYEKDCIVKDNELRSISTKNMPNHLIPRPGAKFDDRAWQFLVRKVPKYQIYNTRDFKDFF